MSLRGQFFVSVILALVVSLSFEGILACWHAQLSVGTEMRTSLAASDQMVDAALVSVPLTKADAYLALLVHSFDGDRHVRAVLMAQNKVVTTSTLAPPRLVPSWFSGLLQISPETHRFDLAPRQNADVLILITDPRNEIGEVWVQFRDGTAILSLFSLLVLGLLYFLMARTSAPLKRLADGFGALGGGDYAARVAAQGPRELSRLALAFNRMASRLGALEDTNRRLNQQMLTIQEEERSDLARDLHDEMGPFLFAVRIDAETIGTAARKTGLSAIAERAHAIGEAVIHIQQHVRVILKQLRPDGLVNVGLAQAIANLATFWQRRHVGVVIRLDLAEAASGFGEQIDAAIYRLVQEGLTNAVRHSGAREVSVAIRAEPNRILVQVEDDGVGLPAAENVAGLGLRGMNERVTALGGNLIFANRPDGRGTVIAAEIPRKALARLATAAA